MFIQSILKCFLFLIKAGDVQQQTFELDLNSLKVDDELDALFSKKGKKKNKKKKKKVAGF